MSFDNVSWNGGASHMFGNQNAREGEEGGVFCFRFLTFVII